MVIWSRGQKLWRNVGSKTGFFWTGCCPGPRQTEETRSHAAKTRGDDSNDLFEQLGRKNVRLNSSELSIGHNVDRIPQGKWG